MNCVMIPWKNLKEGDHWATAREGGMDLRSDISCPDGSEVPTWCARGVAHQPHAGVSTTSTSCRSGGARTEQFMLEHTHAWE
jgi:hypothetical protein